MAESELRQRLDTYRQAFFRRLLTHCLSRRDASASVRRNATAEAQDEADQDTEEYARRILKDAQIFHLRERHYEKRELFFSLRTPKKLFAGGNQIAKTTSVLAECLSTALQFSPWDPERPPLVIRDTGRIVIAGPNFQHWASDTLIPKLKELIPWDVCVDHVESQGTIITKIFFYTGWTLKILSYDQDTSVYESWTCDLMAFDEPPPYNHWGGAMRGCKNRRAPVIIAYTPWGDNTAWTHDELYLPAFHVESRGQLEAANKSKIACVHATLEDNPYYDDQQRRDFYEEYRDRPEEFEARIKGNYSIFMGRVYKNFAIEKHVRELEACI